MTQATGRAVPVLEAIPDSWPFENGPVLIPGGATGWSLGEAVESGRFEADYGAVVLEAHRRRDPAVWQVTLREFLEYCRGPQDGDDPWYAKRWTVWELLTDFVGASLPPSLQSWFDRSATGARLSWAWVFIGPSGSRSPLHVDTMCSSAWNALITGRKAWRFLSPGATVARGLMEPELLDTVSDTAEYELELVQEPGDLLIVPSLWGHEVLNTEAGVALTGNFVNADNHRAVERFLEITGRTGWLSTVRSLSNPIASQEDRS